MTHPTAHIADTAIFTEHQPVFVTLEDALEHVSEIYRRLALQAISSLEQRVFSNLSYAAKRLRIISHTVSDPTGLLEIAKRGNNGGFIEAARERYHAPGNIPAFGFNAAMDIVEFGHTIEFDAALAVIVLQEAEDLLVKPLRSSSTTL